MNFFKVIFLILFNLLTIVGWGQKDVFPEPMNPPRLVNDFANVLSADELQNLEQRVLNYNNSTSIEIAIVTVNNLHGYEVADYTIKLANKWKIGKQEKDNGVLVLASIEDRKMFIATGYGMEGVMTDALSGRIYRNEMAPAFRVGDYYQGFTNAVDAIVAVSKDEYTADEIIVEGEESGFAALIFVVILIVIIIAISSRGKGGNGGRGGTYMSRRGSDIVIGSILGEMLSGGRGGGGFGGSSGGGFGGFGGGSFGGGGAGGSW